MTYSEIYIKAKRRLALTKDQMSEIEHLTLKQLIVNINYAR